MVKEESRRKELTPEQQLRKLRKTLRTLGKANKDKNTVKTTVYNYSRII